MACTDPDNPYCTGDDEDGDCTGADPCAPNCLGHFGQPVPCQPCPNTRCVSHDAVDGTCDHLCDRINCTGHRMDEDNDLVCIATHPFWCDEDCPADDGEDYNHERDFGNGVTVTGQLFDDVEIYVNIAHEIPEYTSVVAEADQAIADTEAMLDSLRDARDVLADHHERVAALKG